MYPHFLSSGKGQKVVGGQSIKRVEQDARRGEGGSSESRSSAGGRGFMGPVDAYVTTKYPLQSPKGQSDVESAHDDVDDAAGTVNRELFKGRRSLSL